MRGKHRVTRSLGLVAAVVVVCGLAVLLGYAMGNYAITAVMTARRKPSPASAPAAAPAPRAPASPSSTPEVPASPDSPPAGSRLLTELEDAAKPGSGAQPAGPERPAASSDRPSAAPLYRVQVGPFSTRQEAVTAARQLLAEGYPTYVTSDRPYRVQVGAFTRREAAARLLAELQAKRHANARLVEP